MQVTPPQQSASVVQGFPAIWQGAPMSTGAAVALTSAASASVVAILRAYIY